MERMNDQMHKRLLHLFKRLQTVPPSSSDSCAWILLERALKETCEAQNAQLFESKAAALVLLCKFGWRDVFKESLTADGLFKSKEEAGRFDFCHAHA